MFRVSSPGKMFRGALPLFLLALSLFPLHSSSQLPTISFVRNPDAAPSFKLKDLSGQDLTLEQYRGKVILLNFWATWCGPCREEIPDLIQLQERYKDRMQIIGLVVDADDDNEVRDVVKQQSINYPVAIVTAKIRMDYGGITALPTVFVINSEGRVVQKHVGLFNPALYETEVRALLDMPVNVRIETFEDTGEIFLKHADRATMLPGVNTSSLTNDQRALAMRKFNAESCTCGCKFTLAQCRIYDPACKFSMDRTAAIVKEVAAGEKVKPQGPVEPAAPAATPAADPPPARAPAPPAPPPTSATPQS